MKELILCIKKMNVTINKLIVTSILIIVYFTVILSYHMFIRKKQPRWINSKKDKYSLENAKYMW